MSQEIDAEVAEKVMGWKRHFRNSALYVNADDVNSGEAKTQFWADDFRPSTDFRHASMVVQKVRERLFSRRELFVTTLQRIVSERELPSGALIHHSHLIFFTTPLDICNAALLAVSNYVG